MKSTAKDGPAGNFFTAAEESSGIKAQRLIEAQSIASLIGEARARMCALLSREGYRPMILGTLAPVVDANGARTTHEGRKVAAYFAEIALLCSSRFNAAWKAQEWALAAENAYLVGEYAAKAYMHSRKSQMALKGKFSGSQEARSRNGKILLAAYTKLEERRGYASHKQLYDWLKICECRISLPRFSAILKADNFEGKKAEIRRKYLAKR